MPVDRARIARAVTEILQAIGEDTSRPGLANTPNLVADAYAELVAGLDEDPGEHLRKSIPFDGSTDVVVVNDIRVRSLCEHHLLPFTGRALVAYVPGDRIVGLGKLPRVVRAVAARPQIQERLTDEIARVLDSELQPRGVLVVIESSHDCMTSRGVNEPGSLAVTVATRGCLSEPGARAELMALFGGSS